MKSPSHKIRFIAACLAGLLPLVAVGLVAVVTHAQTTGSRVATLEQRLRFGLQARLPSEVAFINAVVDTVSRGELPLKLVDRTFFWARRRTPRQGNSFARRPIIYFRPALNLQADRLDIDIRPNAPPPRSGS